MNKAFLPKLSRIIAFRLFSLLIFSLFSACIPQRSYLQPSSQPAELVKTATVETPSPIFRNNRDLIRIVALDGKPIDVYEHRLVVSPVSHEFRVVAELIRPQKPIMVKGKAVEEKSKSVVTKADTTLRFTAEAGKSYLIDANTDGRSVWVWAIDSQNKFIVAGEPPPLGWEE